MDFDHVAFRREPRFAGDVRNVIEQTGVDAFLNRAAVVADGHDAGLLMTRALTCDVGVKRLEPMNLSPIRQHRQCSVDSRGSHVLLLRFAHFSEHVIRRQRSAAAAQYRENFDQRLFFVPAQGLSPSVDRLVTH